MIPLRTSLALIAAAFGATCLVPSLAAAADDEHQHHYFCGHTTLGEPGEFNLNNRWASTATNGGGLQQGDATTLTWSIAPDGTSWYEDSQPSNLISFLDNIVGAGPGGSDLTQRPWFDSFQRSFDRWSELGGVDYVYVSDDGAGTFTPGQLGQRGDVRIGGNNIDGNGSVLAYNYYPNNGDMTLDTGDANFYAQSSNNYRPLRNVIMHEHGHGLGMAHVSSSDSRFLMEPFIQTQFDGPQYDEIRALHRAYGDVHEKSGGNDAAGSALFLGNATAGTLGIGLDGNTGTIVDDSETDFVSIDGLSDTDFFAFAIDGGSTLDLLLTPEGPTYFQGPQGGNQSEFDSSAVSDLNFTLFDTDGTTPLITVDLTDAGMSEMLSAFPLASAGTYFVQVSGEVDNVQLYSLTLSSTLVPEPGSIALLGVVGLMVTRRSRRH